MAHNNRAVILPNGMRRIEYIRNRYYRDGVSRIDIVREINRMFKEVNRNERVQYITILRATETTSDPRTHTHTL